MGKTATPDFSALDDFDLDGLSSKGKANGPTPDGRPARAPRSSFRPDPNQPRRKFDPVKLKSLALSLKSEGVKTPLIVRSPDAAGVMQIADGERRWRASDLEEIGDLPYVIDDTYDKLSQLIVNAQREDNTADEKAATIVELEERGMKRAEIARRMGRSPAYVTELAEFAKLPDELRALYDQERVTDVTLLNLLARLHKKHGEQVLTFAADPEIELTRKTVNAFAESFRQGESPDAESREHSAQPEEAKATADGEMTPVVRAEAGERFKRPVVHVTWNEKTAVLLVNRRASAGKAWIKFEDGKEKEVRFSSVLNVEIKDGR